MTANKSTPSKIKKYGIPADRQHIIGHNEVPDATHSDPGAFPWEAYMQRVANHL